MAPPKDKGRTKGNSVMDISKTLPKPQRTTKTSSKTAQSTPTTTTKQRDNYSKNRALLSVEERDTEISLINSSRSEETDIHSNEAEENQEQESSRLIGTSEETANIEAEECTRQSKELKNMQSAKNAIISIISLDKYMKDHVKKQLLQYLQTIENSILDSELKAMEYKSKLAEAEKILAIRRPQEETNLATPPLEHQRKATSYAEALSNASRTVIVEAVDSQEAQSIPRILQEVGQEIKIIPQALKHTRKGVALRCRTQEEATTLRKTMAETIKSNPSEIKVSEGKVPNKKIMIFHVPDHLAPADVQQAVTVTTGCDSNLVQVFNPFKTNNNTIHYPVLLPQMAANELLNYRTICLGFKECPIKPYIRVIRCFKCWSFDHIAANCSVQEPPCPECGGLDHEAEKCETKEKHCTNCAKFNENNNFRVSTAHSAYSSRCNTYEKVLKCRQLEAQGRGLERPVTANQILTGQIILIGPPGRERLDYPRPPRGGHRATYCDDTTHSRNRQSTDAQGYKTVSYKRFNRRDHHHHH